ncbi:hypothetical protein M1446_04560 [Candidatus Dependentiae bacterium]|nr:hypothetical protein [Candidatus Dependentiae bacterium]
MKKLLISLLIISSTIAMKHDSDSDDDSYLNLIENNSELHSKDITKVIKNINFLKSVALVSSKNNNADFVSQDLQNALKEPSEKLQKQELVDPMQDILIEPFARLQNEALIDKDPTSILAYGDLLQACQNSNFKIDWAGSKKKLKELGLVDDNYKPHPAVITLVANLNK